MKEAIDIEDLRQGNHKAYEMLFTEWYAPLCNYAQSILRDQEEAKDVVQRTFYKLWDYRSNIEIHTSIKSYLYRMVHNNALNKVKQQQIRLEHSQRMTYEMDESVKDADNLVRHNELSLQIDAAIEKLPPRCREVFRMSRFQHKSYAEISKELNITTNTVETQIVKALKVLREELKDYLPLVLVLLMLKLK